jgi:calcineurin-like phosphoesterase family protein
MIYFIADTHFGHENILRMCDRPFASVDAMNEAIIDNWNARFTGNDTVYILGDLFYRCADPEPILRQLKGRKHLIVGNHDASWMDRVDLSKYFVGVDPLLEITDGTHGMTLCHYPLLTWKHKLRTYMVHGHIHRDTTSDYFPLIAIRERMLNAGVDINGFRPVTFDELVENNRRFKEAFLQDREP